MILTSKEELIQFVNQMDTREIVVFFGTDASLGTGIVKDVLSSVEPSYYLLREVGQEIDPLISGIENTTYSVSRDLPNGRDVLNIGLYVSDQWNRLQLQAMKQVMIACRKTQSRGICFVLVEDNIQLPAKQVANHLFKLETTEQGFSLTKQ